jgi:HSP20 family protein
MNFRTYVLVKVKVVSEDDLPEWYRKKKKRSPFFGNWLFGDIEEMMKEMEEMMEREFSQFKTRIPEDLKRERKLPDGTTIPEWGPFVYGYSMTIGPNGKPKIREFGNVKASSDPEKCGINKPCIDVKEEREPLVDIISANSEIKVIVELPGVAKEDIKLRGTEDKLTISVDIPDRKYFKEIEMPTKIAPKKAKTAYKNGVLEVTVPKIEDNKKPSGEEIKIE